MSNLDFDDPVQARLARIFDAKRRDNADILSALKVAEDSWERLNKEVDTAIGQEFDLISSEQAAVLAARDRLDSPDTDPVEKQFVFAGRVFDATSKVGLPQLTVRVLREGDQTGDPLATAITDASGAYRAIVPPEQFDPSGEATAIRVEAMHASLVRPVALERVSLVLAPGGVQQIDLPVKVSRTVGGNVAAGEAARDSIEATIQTVQQRIASMQSAHTATARFSDLTRDGLKKLSAAMATDPPPIVIEGQPPEPGPGPEPEPEPPPTTSTPLEKIPGIGERFAERLRAAGIPDVEALVETPIEKLADILGSEDLARRTLEGGRQLLGLDTGSTPLEKIPGVGEAIAGKLRDNGIPDCEALVAADFDKVVEILGEALAKRAVEGAKKLLERTSTPLEKIPGVGEAIAGKLRDNGIPDCEALVAADFDKVVEILGEALARRAVEGAKRLLEGG